MACLPSKAVLCNKFTCVANSGNEATVKVQDVPMLPNDTFDCTSIWKHFQTLNANALMYINPSQPTITSSSSYITKECLHTNDHPSNRS